MKEMNNNVAMMTAEEMEEARARRRERLQAKGQGPIFYFKDLGMAVSGYGITDEAQARKIAEETIEENLMEGIVVGKAGYQTGANQ